MRDHRFPAAALFAVIVALAPATARASSGGPDSFGYTWADQNEPGVTTAIPAPSGAGTAIALTNESVSIPVSLGFNFPFYGGSYGQFVISDNGWLSFDTTASIPTPVPQALPDSATPNLLLAWYWGDLDKPATATMYSIAGGKMIFIQTKDLGSGQSVEVWICLYQSGLIKIIYFAVGPPNVPSIGIENATGTVGLNPFYKGTGVDGFALASGEAVEYYPPPKLSCNTPVTITCGQTVSSSSPGTVPTNATNYPCSTATYLGNERVFRFTNPTLANVTFALQNVQAGKDLDVLLLRAGSCNESHCQGAGDTQVNVPFLSPGIYEVVVDGKTATDNGTFELRVTCTPKSAVVACQALGDPPYTGTTAGASVWNLYPSCSNQDMDGPEFLYELPFTPPGNIRATLTPDPGVELDLMVFGPDLFDAPNRCLGWGDSSLTLFNPAGGTYYFAVDGRSSGGASAGNYTLGITCDVQLSCASPVGDLQCNLETAGTTIGATNRATQYSCSPTLFTGPEVVYRFNNSIQRTVSFLYTGPPDLSLFLVPANNCNEGACIEYGNGRLVARDLAPGDYFLVVDGANAASGAFRITPVCDSIVTPASAVFILRAGQSAHEHKDLLVNADISRGDIVFAIDLTGSQRMRIPAMKETARQIISGLSPIIDDVQFGLVSFEDYPGNHNSCGWAPGPGYGVATDSPYRLNLPITNDQAALDAAILGLPGGNGEDLPESYLRVLYEMYADAANIGWRNKARRIVVMFGDDEPHVCDFDLCTSPNGNTTTGVDPGRDGVVSTADDLEMAVVQGELKFQGITPIYLDTGQNGVVDEWKCFNAGGGGTAYQAPAGTMPATLIKDLKGLIEAKALACQVLDVRTTPASFQSWLQNITPPSWTVNLPAKVTFELDIVPPLGTAPGIYNFTVDMVCDGVIKASQTVQVTVENLCAPTGRVGNNLYAAQRTNDVLLDWSRGGPVVPRDYNIHRLFAKNLLQQPRADAPLAPLSSAETYTDLNAVPGTPSLYFYDTWGRDCSGQSIYN